LDRACWSFGIKVCCDLIAVRGYKSRCNLEVNICVALF
jgi:hypothetical protein